MLCSPPRANRTTRDPRDWAAHLRAKKVIKDSCAEGAAQVRTPFAPIKALAAKGAAVVRQSP